MAEKEVITTEATENEEVKAVKQTKQVATKETKAKKAKVKEKKGGNKFKAYISEIKKVTWPSFKEVVSRTGVVLAFVGIFVVVLLGMSLGLRPLFNLLTSFM